MCYRQMGCSHEERPQARSNLNLTCHERMSPKQDLSDALHHALTLVIHHMVAGPMQDFAWKSLTNTSNWRALIQLLFLARRVRTLSIIRLTCPALRDIIHTWHRPLALVLQGGNNQLLTIATQPLMMPGPHGALQSFPWHPQAWNHDMAAASGLPGLKQNPLLFKQRFNECRALTTQRIMSNRSRGSNPTGIVTARLNLWLLILQATGYIPMDNANSITRENQVRGTKAILLTALRSSPDLIIPHLRFISINMIRVHLEWLLALPLQTSDHHHSTLQHIVDIHWKKYARNIM